MPADISISAETRLPPPTLCAGSRTRTCSRGEGCQDPSRRPAYQLPFTHPGPRPQGAVAGRDRTVLPARHSAGEGALSIALHRYKHAIKRRTYASNRFKQPRQEMLPRAKSEREAGVTRCDAGGNSGGNLLSCVLLGLLDTAFPVDFGIPEAPPNNCFLKSRPQRAIAEALFSTRRRFF